MAFSALLCALLLAVSVGAVNAATVRVRYYQQGELVVVNRSVPDGMALTDAAVCALVGGPTAEETAEGIITRIPSGVSINKLSISGDTAEIDLSQDVLSGLDEAGLQQIYDQFRTTLSDFPAIASVRLTCNGKLLSTYLAPAPAVGGPASARVQSISPDTTGLSGHSVTIGPSHGRYWVGWWGWQRSDPCNFGEAVLEDTNSIRLCQFLYTYLSADGARVECPRQLDETDCCNSETGLPWWKMAAFSWLHHIGAPCSVWASYSGNCGDDQAVSTRDSDDIRCRPLWADYKNTDIYIACHTNAGGGGTATGTVTYRDTAMEHPSWVSASLNLATQVQNNVCAAIRDMYDPNWYTGRGVQDSAGGFGEIRIPNRPACLIELAFHDNCTKDAQYLTDDFFRSVAEWGLYNGVCAYFGTTPTWAKYSCEVVADTIPTTMQIGHTYTATITLRNRGVCWFTSRGFRLGAPSGSDPFTSFNRVDVQGEVKPGQTYTFSFIMTAPMSPGTYTTRWQMVRDGYQWFGPTVTKQIAVGDGPVEPPDNTGSPLPAKTIDWQSNPTSYVSGWATKTCTGNISEWYTYGVNITGQSCTVYDRNLFWNSSQSWSGRGHFATDVQITCSGTALAKYVMLNGSGADTTTQPTLNECPRNGWYNILDSDWTNLSTSGWRTNPNIADAGSGCSSTCGGPVLSAAGLHMYGDRWQYINDWTCLGGYASSAVTDDHSLAESSLYLYPAIDRTHGDVFLWGGKAPGRVTTGDCNTSSSLNFKGNAGAYGGGDGMDSYGFAWMYAPAGAAPKFLIGSDDGNRVWLNGALINDISSSRSLTRDQDETASTSMPAGWSRVLFKIHNGTGNFEGTMSLRNGSSRNWNEPSVNVFDLGGYLSYGLGGEQDSWYPRIDVASFDGVSNPQPGTKVYTNNTNVTANGTAWVTGPVPLWKVMHFERGYGITGDTNYADVTSSGATWSHTDTGITGHRRFHFFSVSQSHRTSFQSGQGSGTNGGSNWADGGPANYMDVYIDNVAPVAPSFASVKASAPDKIDLSWDIPMDQGVGIAPGSSEDAADTGDNHYRSGDVAVQVRKGTTPLTGWTTTTSYSDTGLTPNKSYTYDIAARDNSSLTRGSWNNTTGYVGSVTRYSLSVAPTSSNVTCSKAVDTRYSTPDFTFSAVGGFGEGTLDHYLYAWDNSPTHSFSGSETSWSSGDLALSASAEGDWYLHVQGFNGEGVANGTLDLGPYHYGTAVDTIGLALGIDNSQKLSLKAKAVTAALPGMFWIEEADRSAALKVISGSSVTVGNLVNVVGVLGLSGAQRALLADSVDDAGLGVMPAPVALVTRSLGGSSFNSLTPGVTTTTGLYNIGLLVRVAGNVSYSNTDDPSAKYFYLDDGSGISDDSGHTGVKVECGSTEPAASGFVVVTGIVSSEQTGAKVVPVLIIRDSNDIKPL